MTYHTLSLTGALILLLVAVVLLFVIGPLGLLVLVLAAIFLWYAFGPGARHASGSG
jgi:hypothetical protein